MSLLLVATLLILTLVLSPGAANISTAGETPTNFGISAVEEPETAVFYIGPTPDMPAVRVKTAAMCSVNWG